MPNPLPIEITKTSPREITIRWDDGVTSVYSIQYLRAECTCARCVNEITGLRILDPRTIAEDLTVLNAEHVGRYGIKFTFSDKHDDGIYTWERLRALDKALRSDQQEAKE
jgi:ATP-binding protein involved in chromosome partitioning